MMYLIKSKRHKNKKYKSHCQKRELDEVNQARLNAGMPPIKMETRNCLKCDAEFQSLIGSANFMCEICGPRNSGGDNWDW